MNFNIDSSRQNNTKNNSVTIGGDSQNPLTSRSHNITDSNKNNITMRDYIYNPTFVYNIGISNAEEEHKTQPSLGRQPNPSTQRSDSVDQLYQRNNQQTADQAKNQQVDNDLLDSLQIEVHQNQMQSYDKLLLLASQGIDAQVDPNLIQEQVNQQFFMVQQSTNNSYQNSDQLFNTEYEKSKSFLRQFTELQLQQQQQDITPQSNYQLRDSASHSQRRMQDGQEKYQIEFDFEQIPLSQHTFDKKEQLMAQNQQQPHQSNKLQQLMEPSEVQKQGLSIQSLQAIEQNDKQDLFQQQVVMDEQQLLLEQQVDQSLKIVQMDDTLQFLKQQVEMKENQNLPQQQVEMELQQYQPLQHEEDKQHQLPKQQEELNEHHHLSQQHHQTYEDYIQMNYQQFNVNLDDAHAKHSQSDISDDDDTDNSKWEPATQSQNEEDKSSELSEDRVFFVTYEQYVRIMRDQNAIIQGLQEYARYQASIQNQGASSPAIHADVTDEDNNQNQDSSGDTLSAKYSSNIEINSQTISNSQQQQVSQASHGNILNLLHQESQIQIQPNNVQASNNDQNEDIDENHDDQCLFIISQLLIIVIILVTMLVTTIIEMA